MLYPPALMKLGYVDFAGLLAALATRLWQMQLRRALSPGQVDQQALLIATAR